MGRESVGRESVGRGEKFHYCDERNGGKGECRAGAGIKEDFDGEKGGKLSMSYLSSSRVSCKLH